MTDKAPSSDQHSSRSSLWVVVALGAITLTGLGLGLYGLGARTMWIDEAETAIYAEGDFLAPFQRVMAGPPISLPPLYFVLIRVLHILHLTGPSHRLPSVLASVACIPLVFLLGRRLHSSVAGLGAAAVLAMTPTHVLYAQEARPYALFALATLLFLLGAVGTMEEDRPRDRALFVGGGALCVWLHPAGVPLVAPVALLVWLRRPTRRTFALCVALAVACVPTLVQLWFQRGMTTASGERLPVLNVQWRADNWYALITSLGASDVLADRASALFVVLPWLAGVLVLALHRPYAAFVLVTAAAAPVAAMLSQDSGYIYYARYAIHVVPIGALLSGVALGALAGMRWMRPAGFALAVALLVVCAWRSAPALRRQYAESGPPYDVVGAIVSELGDPETDVVLFTGIEKPVGFYAPLNVRTLRPYVDPRIPIVFGSPWPGEQIASGGREPWRVTWIQLGTMFPGQGPYVELPVAEPMPDAVTMALGRLGAQSGLLLRPPPRLQYGEAFRTVVARALSLNPRARGLVPLRR